MHLVYHVVSRGSGEGKTRLVELLASQLSARGVRVAAVKHTPHGFNPPLHDTERMLRAGVAVAAAHAPDSYMLVFRGSVSLGELLDIIPSPPVIVLAEGYSSKPLGPVIYVTRTGREPPEKLRGRLLACVSDKPLQGCPETHGWSEAWRITDIILDDAYKRILSMLPGIDCGMCGSDCSTMARRIAAGEARLADCAVLSDVRLVVDGREVPLNPFVKRVVRNLVEALAKSLRGVPPGFREARIIISGEQTVNKKEAPQTGG